MTNYYEYGYDITWYLLLNNYFKAAIYLILASNTPPLPHPMIPPGVGWGGWVGYLRQGLSKVLLRSGYITPCLF